MFIDKVRIKLQGGKGGNGCASFRRERFIPRGGPDGGDGGNGGKIVLRVDPNVGSLVALKYMNHYEAPSGGQGSGNSKHGKNGDDIYIDVPPGTIVRELGERTVEVADLDDPGDEFIGARGGNGGRGNRRFASSTNRSPRRCDPGTPGEERHFELELKIIADVGLVGYPNAGKSTFLGAVTNARPKTAAYPFTTLAPHIGTIEFDDMSRMTIADIPGLIDGAHEDIGLGHDFLRHIERTKLLAYVLDMSSLDERPPWAQLQCLRDELACYNADLPTRRSVILANKMDEAGAAACLTDLRARTDLTICPISAILGDNTAAAVSLLRERITTPPVG